MILNTFDCLIDGLGDFKRLDINKLELTIAFKNCIMWCRGHLGKLLDLSITYWVCSCQIRCET